MLAHALLSQAGHVFGRNKLSTLIYHQIAEQPDPLRPEAVHKAKFRWHMKLIRDHFNPLPIGEAVQRLQEGTLPANSVCVTFDDGYRDNLEIAQPIMAEFDIPATVYIATAFSDGLNMWNDRLYDLIGNRELTSLNLERLDMGVVAISDWPSRQKLAGEVTARLKYEDYRERRDIVDGIHRDNSAAEAPRKMMTPEEIRELSRRGVDIGAHTVDHPILKSLPVEEQKRQLLDCRHFLEALIDKPVTGLAYPNGTPGVDYDGTTVEIVKSCGFHYAASTTWGVSTRNTSVFELNRSTPWDATPLRFHLRMLKYMMSRR